MFGDVRYQHWRRWCKGNRRCIGKAIAVALESNTTLTWINLSGMELFAVLLVDCCDKCRVGTAIGDDGAKAIEKALETNTTLKTIRLDGTCLNVCLCVVVS
jgi:hypothetical protein